MNSVLSHVGNLQLVMQSFFGVRTEQRVWMATRPWNICCPGTPLQDNFRVVLVIFKALHGISSSCLNDNLSLSVHIHEKCSCQLEAYSCMENNFPLPRKCEYKSNFSCKNEDKKSIYGYFHGLKISK